MTTLPNLFIPGAQKSGTTSLYRYLREHPECHMSSPKELYFFCKEGNLKNVDDYITCFDNGSKIDDKVRVVGEATTTYFSDVHVPARIRSLLGGDAKFIFILRDPVQRAVSAYWHMQKRFDERRKISDVFSLGVQSSDEAIEEELRAIRIAHESELINIAPYGRISDDPYWAFRYVRNSTYLSDLKRFEENFGRDRMLMVFSEDLRTDPVDTFCKIANFLSIDPQFKPPNLGRLYNTTVIPKQGRFWRVLDSTAKLFHGGRFRKLQKRIHRTTVHPKPDVEPRLLETLTSIFRSHNEQLSSYLGEDIFRIWT